MSILLILRNLKYFINYIIGIIKMEYTTANILHHSYSIPNSVQNSRSGAKIVEIVKILNLYICN